MSTTIEPSVEPRGWRPAHKIAFRFAFAYLALYNLPFPAGFVPKTDWIGDGFTWVWHKLGVLVGDVVFGLDIQTFSNGSGDTSYDYVMVFAMAAIAAVAAVAWTLADRRRLDYRRLDAALRVYIRYVLALTMMTYGLAKVFKTQFPYPTPDRLSETYGESSPMGLLWTMMGYSYGYNLFTGLVEVVGGVLLFWRRTTLLGALVSAGALVNIVMLNVCYDVPVKLYSTHLLLMSVYVMAPDLGRLAGVLILNRPVAARPPRAPLSRRLGRARLAAKTLFIGVSVYVLVDMELDNRKMITGNGETRPPVIGVFDADTFEIGGVVHPPLVTDGPRWRSIAFNDWGGCIMRTMDGTSARFNARFDAAPHLLSLSPFSEGKPTEMLYRIEDADHLALVGVHEGKLVAAHFTRRPVGNQLLMSRGFHWVNEYPLNR